VLVSTLRPPWLERRRMVVVVPLLCLAAVAAALLQRGHAHHSPVFATLPVSAHVADVRTVNHGCVSSDGLDAPKDAGGFWVDRHPTGGRALWLPGLNAGRCRARLTVLNARQATAFTRAVEQAPPLPSGARLCPMDDESGVTVYLTYRGTPKAEVVRVRLTGCASVGAPGRGARELTPQATSALKPFPDGWR
jgi:hypothetical protein